MEKKISITRMNNKLSSVRVDTGVIAQKNPVREKRNCSAQVKKITAPITKNHKSVYDSESFLFRSSSMTNRPFNSAIAVMICFSIRLFSGRSSKSQLLFLPPDDAKEHD